MLKAVEYELIAFYEVHTTEWDPDSIEINQFILYGTSLDFMKLNIAVNECN